jgi:hypothetical protein
MFLTSIERILRWKAAKRFMFGMILCAASATAITFEHHDARLAVFGPQMIVGSQMETMATDDPSKAQLVTIDVMVPASAEQSTSDFYPAVANGTALQVQTSGTLRSGRQTISGVLTAGPTLNLDEDPRGGYLFWLTLALSLGGVGLFFAGQAFRTVQNPRRSKAYIALDAKDPHAVDTVNRMLSDKTKAVERIHPLAIGHGWVVDTMEGKAMGLNDIAWIYGLKIVNTGVGTTSLFGAKKGVILNDVHGDWICQPAKDEADSRSLIRHFMRLAPFAMSGYSPEMSQSWHTNRPAAIAMLRQARVQLDQDARDLEIQPPSFEKTS